MLFGCGVWGIRANDCVQGDILRTEIYECSLGAATFMRTDGFVFTDCSVHDCYDPWEKVPVNRIMMSDSGDCSYNGAVLRNGSNPLDEYSTSEALAVAVPYSPAVVIPTPEISSEAAIHLFFYENEITAERGGFTMHVGEEPITLTAKIIADGEVLQPTGFEWFVDDPEAVGLEPGPSGARCQVRPIAAVQGGTTLTIVDPAAGLELKIPVYVVE